MTDSQSSASVADWDKRSLSEEPAFDLDALRELDCTNAEGLRSTLARLAEARADRCDPVRFRFIQVLVQKALDQRPAVAAALERKAQRALSGYLADYLDAREQARLAAGSTTPEHALSGDDTLPASDAGDVIRIDCHTRLDNRRDGDEQGPLASLTREILQRRKSGHPALEPLFEHELRQQEWDVMQSVSDGGPLDPAQCGEGLRHARHRESDAVHYFRETLRRSHSERRVTQVIQDGPENPGPLNSEALVIRSLAMMHDLSPSYASRFVAYMDTLLWLEQAGHTPRRRGR